MKKYSVMKDRRLDCVVACKDLLILSHLISLYMESKKKRKKDDKKQPY